MMAARKSYQKKRRETPIRGKGWLDPATWAGIFSILIALPAGYTIWLLAEKTSHNPQSSDFNAFLLVFGVFPFVFLSALSAVVGIVFALKRATTRGLWLSVAGLVLAAGLFLASARFPR